jgi:hypothetical protein
MLGRTSDRKAVLAFHRWPLLAVIVYACSILRLMQVGGGNLMPWQKIAVQFATYGFGHWFLAAVFVVLGFLELRRSSEYRTFFVLLLVIPVLAATRAEYLHVRYFVIMLPFLLALAARALGSISASNRWGPAVAAVLLVGYLGAQAGSTAELFRHGRGGYRDACRFMSVRNEVRVASDHEFRARTVMGYYSDARLVHTTASTADWLVLQTDESRNVPARVEHSGRQFGLERHFPTAPLSGMHWYVYRTGTITAATSSSYATR